MDTIVDENAQARLLTANDARSWAHRVPALLRREFERLPDAADQVDTGPIKDGKPFRAIGIGIGAILAISTFAKFVPRKMKWVTAAGAVAASAAGLYYGREADRCLSAVGHAIPAVKEAVLAYAHQIEMDADLREKLARHLASCITAQDTSFRPLEFAVIGKAIEFGRVNGNFDPLTTSTTTPREHPRAAAQRFGSAFQRG